MSDRKIGLDYIRAVAIALVVIDHYSEAFGTRHSVAWSFGMLGVELFFVLSGFLIGGIFIRDVNEAGNHVTPRLIGTFWVRRWLRTVPNYLLFLVLQATVIDPSATWSVLTYLTFTQNLFCLHSSFYLISWSLCVEEWFYLLFPILVLTTFSMFGRFRWAVLSTAALLFFIPMGLRLAYAGVTEWEEGMRKVVLFHLDAIMWGVGLACCKRYRPTWFSAAQKPMVAVVGLGGMVFASVWIGLRYANGIHFIGTVADAFIIPAFDLSAALLIPLASKSRGVGRLPDRLAYSISLWSYSMYLAHQPVLQGMCALADATGLWSLGRKGIVPLIVLANFAVSAGVYYAFEAPILRLRDRWTKHRHPINKPDVVTSPSASIKVSR